MRIIILLTAFLCINACTIAPQAVQHSAASQWIKENRIGYDSTGYIVKQEWVRAYRAAFEVYGVKLPIRERPDNPEEGIVQRPDGNFHVSFIANRRFDHMNDIEENGAP